MKTNDIKELHTKTVIEINKLIKDAGDLLKSLRLDMAQNKLKNTRELFNKRKEIAILKTILKEKGDEKNG